MSRRTTTTREYDAFLSFPPGGKKAAAAVRQALEAADLRVRTREKIPMTDQEIRRDLADGLASATTVVALVDPEYVMNRACQAEILAAYLVGEAEGNAAGRVTAVEIGGRLPGFLSVGRVEAPADGNLKPALAEVVTRVQKSVRSGVGSLGRGGRLAPPPWQGIDSSGSVRFVGRLAEMSSVHQTLRGARGGEPVFLSGPAGIGKSALALEYALRFQPAYPGGVFWLRAYGNDDMLTGMGSDERNAERDRQVRDFAGALGVIIANRGPADIRRALDETIGLRQKAALWIVDDLPRGLDSDALQDWIGPHHGLMSTLVTTQSSEYGPAPGTMTVPPLSADEGYAFLTGSRNPTTKREQQAARDIAAVVGGHPLALTVAAGAIRTSDGKTAYTQYQKTLEEPQEQETELSGTIGVPIARALLHSIRQLDEQGRDVLRLASALSTAPIVPQLVSSTRCNLSDGDDKQASGDAELGIASVVSHALAEQATPTSSFSVHPVVAEATRYADEHPARIEVLRAAAVLALLGQLPRAYDPTAYAALEFEIAHARELVRRPKTVTEADLLGRVARYDLVRGAYASATILFQRAREANVTLYGESHKLTAEAIGSLAGAYFVLGDMEQAKTLYRQTLAIRREVSGAQDPETVAAMNNLAVTMNAQGELSEAQRLQEEMFDIQLRTLGESHPRTTSSAWNLFVTMSRLNLIPLDDSPLGRHLNWLLHQDAANLPADQRKIRDLVANATGF